jgi:small-conductance mechanosensitive channel
MKLLRASVRSSQKIDQSFEQIFNVVFYFASFFVILALVGADPLALFASLSTFVLGFSFMISRASSNYFEGLLFILCRRPYDIGDRIVIQPVDSPTDWHGATEWIVRDIDLFTTTVIYAYTNEVATLSNGSIANSRVMNGARSLPAILYAILRFGVDVSYEQLEIFREALAQYVEARPREWAKLWALRVLKGKQLLIVIICGSLFF